MSFSCSFNVISESTDARLRGRVCRGLDPVAKAPSPLGPSDLSDLPETYGCEGFLMHTGVSMQSSRSQNQNLKVNREPV